MNMIKFEASWCAPCKKMNPIIDKLKEEFKNLNFLSKDVDEDYELTQKFKIQSVPYFILTNDDKEIARLTGIYSKEELTNFININAYNKSL